MFFLIPQPSYEILIYIQNAEYNGTDFMLFSKPKFFAETRIE